MKKSREKNHIRICGQYSTKKTDFCILMLATSSHESSSYRSSESGANSVAIWRRRLCLLFCEKNRKKLCKKRNHVRIPFWMPAITHDVPIKIDCSSSKTNHPSAVYLPSSFRALKLPDIVMDFLTFFHRCGTEHFI